MSPLFDQIALAGDASIERGIDIKFGNSFSTACPGSFVLTSYILSQVRRGTSADFWEPEQQAIPS